MSNLGISIVGSVAQAATQAQELGRALHRRQTDPAADARKVRERLAAHFEGLEEGDEANQLAELRIDDQVPQRDPSPDQPDQHATPAAETVQADANETETPAADATNNAPSYRPLDITA